MSLHNEAFGDDVRFEGVLSGFEGLSLVISQPLIAGSLPTREAVNAFLSESGFEKIEDDFWLRFDRAVALRDTKTANFIEQENGVIQPIDVVIFIPTQAMLDWWSRGS